MGQISFWDESGRLDKVSIYNMFRYEFLHRPKKAAG